MFCLFWTLPAHGSADEDLAAREWERFAGVWQCVGGERGGEKLTSNQAIEIRMVFQGKRLTLHTQRQRTTFDVRIDPCRPPRCSS